MLDDGWFGERNGDTSSLGDWFVNVQKFPQGLRPLIDSVHAMEMKFGLWFEPEMISRRSELFSQHPDWILNAGQQPLSEGRTQYILDLGREEVRDNILTQLSEFLASHPIDYIKWDMNRNMTEVGSSTAHPACQQETAHRYILGVYALLDALTTRFPHILFECCAGGGGRFDPECSTTCHRPGERQYRCRFSCAYSVLHQPALPANYAVRPRLRGTQSPDGAQYDHGYARRGSHERQLRPDAGLNAQR